MRHLQVYIFMTVSKMAMISNANQQLMANVALLFVNTFLESSEESSEEDEDQIIIDLCKKKRKLRVREIYLNYADIVDIMDNTQFKKNFRLNRKTYEFILEELREFLTNLNNVGRKQKPAKLQLLIALWFFSNPASYRDLASRFALPESTALACVYRVVVGLNKVRDRYIYWPRNPEHNAESFQRLWGFPGVVGAVDGSHINIPLYKTGQGYVNRKGNASILLQVVADHTMNFIHCYTGEAGSLHDQRVFRLSGLQDICNNEEYFPGNTHLIGDCAYAIQEHVLVPFKDNGHLTPEQENYNTILSRSRLVVERALGMLKGRWRKLLLKLPMIRIDLIPSFIMAACVLHNICISKDDFFIRRFEDDQMKSTVRQNNIITPASKRAGSDKRIEILNELQVELN